MSASTHTLRQFLKDGLKVDYAPAHDGKAQARIAIEPDGDVIFICTQKYVEEPDAFVRHLGQVQEQLDGLKSRMQDLFVVGRLFRVLHFVLLWQSVVPVVMVAAGYGRYGDTGSLDAILAEVKRQAFWIAGSLFLQCLRWLGARWIRAYIQRQLQTDS